MSLLLPRYLANKEAYSRFQTDEFKKTLEAFVNENAEVDEPYYILFKQNVNICKPNEMRAAMGMSFIRPKFISRSMVFWVDNSRGICEWLWSVNKEGQIKFNIEGAKKLKGILRSVAD